MGGYGSGRSGGRCLVENGYRLNIDRLVRGGLMKPGVHGCKIEFASDYLDDIAVECIAHVPNPWDGWMLIRYEMTDYWSGEELKINDQVFLRTTRPPFGGVRWWFICPRSNRRVRNLHLPLGGRHFWSRRSYRLAYASQGETFHDRAERRARKLCAKLGGDPSDDEYPDKPKRMRWATYNRLIDKLVAADRVADERFMVLAQRWLRYAK